MEVRGTLPVKVTPFLVKNPNRVVLDIEGAMVDAGKPPEVTGTVRYAQFNPNTVRVVVQVDNPPTLRAGERPSALVTAVEWSGAKSTELQPLSTESLPTTTPEGISLEPPANTVVRPGLSYRLACAHDFARPRTKQPQRAASRFVENRTTST